MSSTTKPIAAALVAGTLLLAGCGSTIEAKSGDEPSEPKASVEVDNLEPEESEEPPAEEPEEEPEVTLGKFGGAPFEYEDGLKISVSRPKSYQPDMESCACPTGVKNYAVFTITVENQTGAIYDPSQMYVTATSGESESEEAYDGDLGGTPTGKVLPGRKINFQNVFGATKGQPFTMEIAAGYTADEESEYGPAIFTP
jgi:hypothetical protein